MFDCLPPEIIHHILSLLLEHDLHNTCVASRYCFDNCSSLTYIRSGPLFSCRNQQLLAAEEAYRLRVLGRIENGNCTSITLLGGLKRPRSLFNSMSMLARRMCRELFDYRERAMLDLIGRSCLGLTAFHTTAPIQDLEGTLRQLPRLKSLSVHGAQALDFRAFPKLQRLRVWAHGCRTYLRMANLPELSHLTLYIDTAPFTEWPLFTEEPELISLDTLPFLKTLELLVAPGVQQVPAIFISGSACNMNTLRMTGPFMFVDESDLASFLQKMGRELQVLSLAGLKFRRSPPPTRLCYGTPHGHFFPKLKALEWLNCSPAYLTRLSFPSLEKLVLRHQAMNSQTIAAVLERIGITLKLLSIASDTSPTDHFTTHDDRFVLQLVRLHQLTHFQMCGPYRFSETSWTLLSRRFFGDLRLMHLWQPQLRAGAHGKQRHPYCSLGRQGFLSAHGGSLQMCKEEAKHWHPEAELSLRRLYRLFLYRADPELDIVIAVGALSTSWNLTASANEIRSRPSGGSIGAVGATNCITVSDDSDSGD